MLTDLLKDCKTDYKLWRDDEINFQKKLLIIEEIFNLRGKSEFRYTDSPVYFSGRYKNPNTTILFGLNPGAQKTWEETIEKKKRKSWKDFLEYCEKRFLYFRDTNTNPLYYKDFWHLFGGIMKIKKNTIIPKWEFFDTNIVNINLIPYHSKGLSHLPIKKDVQLDFLKKSFEKRLDFIKKKMFKPKLIIFHGKIWMKLLTMEGFLDKHSKDVVTKKFNIYYFSHDSTPCVLFDKFFPTHFFGLTMIDKKETIPKLILKEYPKLNY